MYFWKSCKHGRSGEKSVNCKRVTWNIDISLCKGFFNAGITGYYMVCDRLWAPLLSPVTARMQQCNVVSMLEYMSTVLKQLFASVSVIF